MSERTDMYVTCCCLVPSALLLKFSPSIFILSTCSWPLPSTRLTAYAGRVKQKGTFKLTTGLFCLSSLIKVQSGWRLQGCSVSSERINVLMDPEKGEEIGKKKSCCSHWTVLGSFWQCSIAGAVPTVRWENHPFEMGLCLCEVSLQAKVLMAGKL